MKTIFKENDLILFQGDSITDGGRNYRDRNDLGTGYAYIAASMLLALNAGKKLRVLNRGVSGDCSCDLVRRWERDCIDLKPNWVSIMIGINNTWRRYDQNEGTDTQVYEKEYREILDRTKEDTHAGLILIEPFLLPFPDDRKSWREDLDPKIKVVNKLAAEYDAILIPMDKIFQQMLLFQGPEYWAEDGVHPTLAGHGFIAMKWMEYVIAK